MLAHTSVVDSLLALRIRRLYEHWYMLAECGLAGFEMGVHLEVCVGDYAATYCACAECLVLRCMAVLGFKAYTRDPKKHEASCPVIRNTDRTEKLH